jgi:hypothetical protein
MSMTNEELNFRLQVCAEAGMPYSDKLWNMLASAWDRGYRAGVDDVESGLGPGAGPNINPFRGTNKR